ncbi:uncharacterized protein LOC123201423 isoform X2 [Mangifera indica]|uniref:uncharacterized protein LOC123201423 isoform X2 n=1 Tax=Mangifera indica TaxID=29780 RepID=UPI001CFA49F1|nr:uncharacterized protein LOC123201423 isoform X2 [Mangifera indica]
MLRRWLAALKGVERVTAFYLVKDSLDQLNFDEAKDSVRRPTLVYYADPDMDTGPRNFRDVFLYSQALEGITMSMVYAFALFKFLKNRLRRELLYYWRYLGFVLQEEGNSQCSNE